MCECEQGDACGDGDVERLFFSMHGDLEDYVAFFEEWLRDTPDFVAEQYCEWLVGWWMPLEQGGRVLVLLYRYQ